MDDEVLYAADLVEPRFVFSPCAERLIRRSGEEVFGGLRHEPQVAVDEIRDGVLPAVLGDLLRDRDELGRDVRPLEGTDFAAAETGVNADEAYISERIRQIGRRVVDAHELVIGEEPVAFVDLARLW